MSRFSGRVFCGECGVLVGDGARYSEQPGGSCLSVVVFGYEPDCCPDCGAPTSSRVGFICRPVRMGWFRVEFLDRKNNPVDPTAKFARQRERVAAEHIATRAASPGDTTHDASEADASADRKPNSPTNFSTPRGEES